MRRAPLTAILIGVLRAAAACGQEQESVPAADTGGAEPSAALPDLASVVCAADGTRVETPAVRPRPDGIHVEIVNETGAERSFSATSAGGGLGTGAPPGISEQVLDLEPGELTVACQDPLSGEGASASVEVVDEDGIWVSTRLECDEVFNQVTDYIQGARGETSDPVAAAREALESYGVEPDDVLEPAGYPAGSVAKIRLVRAGEVLAVVDLVDDGAGRWLPSQVSGCSSLQR